MSKNSKILIGVAVVLVIVVGLIAFRQSASAPTASTEGTLPSGASTSDTALNQDAAAIDSQLKGLDSDRATLDQGISQSSAQ